jgi:Rrf2 family protein
MLELALHYGEGPVPLRDVAKRQGLSEKYLWNLMRPLKDTGLIHSTRGSYGGFTLAKSPSEINMKEIVSALEGSLCLVQCIDDPAACERVRFCAIRDVWSAVSDSIMETLESFTLRDMVESHGRKGTIRPMYAI